MKKAKTTNGKRKRTRSTSSRPSKRNPWKAYSSGAMSAPVVKPVWVTHKYCDTAIEVDPGVSGIPGVYVYSANGLYDPNVTASGHQAYMFDQYKELFASYAVSESMIKIGFYNLETTNPTIVGISLLKDSAQLGDAVSYMEQPGTVWAVMSPKLSGYAPVKELSLRWSCKDIEGYSADKFDNSGGTATSNPVTQYYFHVWVAPLDGSTDVGKTKLASELTYRAKWWEFNTPPLS